MRFARLRHLETGKDIHIWVDDGFDPHDANLVIGTLQSIFKAEQQMPEKGRRHYEFSDEAYEKVKESAA